MRACLLAMLCAISCAPAPAADKPVPKYEGKPLEYWVTRLQKAETDDERNVAAGALKAFGPDAAPALPTFIEMLADHSYGYRTRVIDIVATIGPKAKEARPIIAKLVRDKKATPYDGSIEAIVALSPEPKDAAAALVPLLDVPTMDFTVYRELCRLGPDAKGEIPAIRRYVMKHLAAVEKGKEDHFVGTSYLAELGPDAVPLLAELLEAHSGFACVDSLKCLEKFGPDATKATPALLKLLKKSDPATRLQTAAILWKVEKHPEVITACAQVLKADLRLTDADPSNFPLAYTPTSIAARAAGLLGEIGPDAKAALPQLREAAAAGLACWVCTGNCQPLFPSYPPRVTYRRKIINDADAQLQWQIADKQVWLGCAALQAIDKIEAKPAK